MTDSIVDVEERESITLSLSAAEAIVLFEWLARTREADADWHVVDQAEERVLWDVECLLERELVSPMRRDYGRLLGLARDEVRDEGEAPGA